MPAYIVFSDATLIAMAERPPRTEPELLAIPGVGPRKLAAYGEAFLALLRTLCDESRPYCGTVIGFGKLPVMKRIEYTPSDSWK